MIPAMYYCQRWSMHNHQRQSLHIRQRQSLHNRQRRSLNNRERRSLNNRERRSLHNSQRWSWRHNSQRWSWRHNSQSRARSCALLNSQPQSRLTRPFCHSSSPPMLRSKMPRCIFHSYHFVFVMKNANILHPKKRKEKRAVHLLS